MIDFYYLAYSGNADDMLSKINPIGLDCIDYAIDKENDVLLAHAIYYLITQNKICDKNKIEEYIWKKLSPLYRNKWESDELNSYMNYEYNEKKEKDKFKSIFDFLWKKKFALDKTGKSAKKFKSIALRNRSLSQRLIFNFPFVLILTIAFLVFCRYVINLCDFYIPSEEDHTILLSVIVLYCSLICSVRFCNIYWLPVIVFIIYIAIMVYDIFLPLTNLHEYGYEYETVRLIAIEKAKRDFLMGILFFLLYPCLYIFKKVGDQE